MLQTIIGGRSRPLAASPWMRGGGCLTSRLDDNWRRLTVLPATDDHCTPRSLYLPHRLGCEAAVALPCLLEDNRRPQSTYLPPCRKCEAADALPCLREDNWRPAIAIPAASTTTGGGSRPTGRRRSLEAQSIYLLPRSGCEASVDLHASMKKTGGGNRLTCCLAVDARRRMLYLPQTTTATAGALLAADDHWRPQSPYLRHRCLEDADVHSLPRR